MNAESKITDIPEALSFGQIDFAYIYNIDLVALRGYSTELLDGLRADIVRVYRSTDNQSKRDIITHVLSNIDAILLCRNEIGKLAAGITLD